MKPLTYEFKEGDCVDCTNLTDEQVQMILDRMWELGAERCEGLEGRWEDFQILELKRDGCKTFFEYDLDEDYNQITWEEIMKHEQGTINWQNVYYKLEESDKTVGRIRELAEKMSKVSGYEIEDYITGFTNPSTELEWNFLVCGDDVVELMDGSLSKNSEVTEQQLDARIKEMSESFNELVESGKYRDEDMENCKTSIEEASESALKTPCLEDVTTWKCFKQVADVLGEEHAEYELKKVLQGYREGDVKIIGEGDLVKNLLVGAFDWWTTSRGYDFWDEIDEGVLPKGYHTAPDVKSYKPTLKIPDDTLENIKETFTNEVEESSKPRSQSVGELVEELSTKLLPSDVTISINGNGQILLHSNTTPVVDVSKLSAEDVDKAYEVMVMLEGCFVECNEKEGE